MAAFGNCEVGLKTVVTLELDITAAAAAPEKKEKKIISTDMLLNKANCCHRKGIIAKIWQHVDFQLQNTI